MNAGTGAIDIVGIIGGGTMGVGIGEVIARHGRSVHIVETSEKSAEAALAKVVASLDKLVRRHRLHREQRDEIVSRLSASADYERIAACDLVIEAVPEILALKRQVVAQVDQVVRPSALIATNTSALSVMDIALGTRRPNRVVGLHFFNPAPVMELVELVRTPVTDESVLDTVRDFAHEIGKSPIVVDDQRGFIVNRLLFPYLNQAVWMAEGGYAAKADIDTAMRLGAGLPMGPLALADLVGIDAFVEIMEAMHEQFQDARFAPRPILRQLAVAGFTGRKAGRGFYRYTDVEPAIEGAYSIEASVDSMPVEGWTTVGIVGTGAMATGIAQVCVQAGFEVIVRGRTRAKAEAVVAQISRSVQQLVERGTLDQSDMVEMLRRIHPTIELDDLASSDLIIEAVTEELAVKREVFSKLSQLPGSHRVLATTTSSLPVIECAMAAGSPESVIGLHFFYPAERMKLVEIVETVRTSSPVARQARQFVSRLGKVGVVCGDRAGFIVSTLLFPYLNDAVKMLESNYATIEDIDKAVKLGCGYPMGPFELMDIVGLDNALSVLERLFQEYHQPAHEAAPLLRRMVEAGFVGRKAGRGFYIYD